MTTLRYVRLVGAGPGSDSGPMDIEFDELINAIRPHTPVDGAECGPTLPTADGAIDASGLHLVPGLIDTHVHLGTVEPLEAAARAGPTTVIDLGTHPDELIERLRAHPGIPSILSAGSDASPPGSTQIAVMGFPTQSGVESPDDAERYLDWRSRHGADLLKIII